MIQDGEKTDDARRYNAPGFDDDTGANIRTSGLLVDATTTFVAKAGAQSGDPLPVEFAWESDDPVVATVNEGTVTGHRRGTAKIVLSVAGRGIEIEIPVTVHNPVKGIILTTDDDKTVEKGTSVVITATAYDEKTDDDGMNDGAEVPGVTFAWSTSKASVATVDTEDSNMSPTIKTHGAGSAEIQAVIGDVKSNKIKVNVFSVEAPERRLVASGQPYGATYTPAVLDEDGETVTTAATLTLATGNGTDAAVIQIAAILQEYRFVDATAEIAGGFRWMNITGTVDFMSLDMATLALAEEGVAATTDGATVDIASDDSEEGQALGSGDVIVRISSAFADDIHVRVSLNAPPAPATN